MSLQYRFSLICSVCGELPAPNRPDELSKAAECHEEACDHTLETGHVVVVQLTYTREEPTKP